ncbi:MAG: sulfite oxidase-like oxidoreductase [Candidatus Microsaccharimonas sp.]
MAVVNKGFKAKSYEHERPRTLPPGQTEVIQWPILSYAPTPHIPTDTWNLTIDGEVKKKITLNWDEFTKLPMTTLNTDIHCVTRWSRLGMKWEGVSLDDLIALAGGLTKDANFVIATTFEGYTTNLPIQDVLNNQAMVALKAHDEPLTPDHGGPARLFVPHLYLWKSAKWIKQLTFTKEDHPGFWEVNGYHNYGDPWLEQRYSDDY